MTPFTCCAALLFFGYAGALYVKDSRNMGDQQYTRVRPYPLNTYQRILKSLTKNDSPSLVGKRTDHVYFEDAPLDAVSAGLWDPTSSEDRIREYLSLVYHQNPEDMPDWRAKWNESEIVYNNVGHLEADDFPPRLRERWEKDWEGKDNPRSFTSVDLKRQLVPNGDWIEVIRHSRAEGEGKNWASACWFYVFKGSGVWIHVGKTAVFDGDDAFAVQKMKEEFPELQSIEWGDAVYAAYARLKGIDSIQTSYSKDWDGNLPELIYLGGVCQAEAIYTGCVPGLEFRTGLQHNLPCKCSDAIKDGDNQVLNCDGSGGS